MRNFNAILIFVFLLMNCSLYGQSKFGNVTLDELNMTSYPKDTAAVALVLNKTGETRFVYNERTGFQFEYTLQMKVKILKSEGLDFCNQSISYYYVNTTNGEKITSLNGTTYELENGKIVKTKLSKEHISDEDEDGKWRLKKFTMPAAKVGSVIEFKYTLVSDYFYDLREFRFQTSAPVLYAKFETVIPEYFHYNTNMQGYEDIKASREPVNETINVRYKDDSGRSRSEYLQCTAQKMTFVGVDLPSIKKEPFLWTLNDYVSLVSFELKQISYPWTTVKNYSSTWANIDEELINASGFGGNLKRTGLFKDEVTKGNLSLDKAREIQDMIKSQVKWDGKNKALSTNLKDALKNGLGSSADMNFLLINALKAAGFDALPVILSTRSNGRLPIANPSVTALNYTITALKLDTLYYFTDASAKYGDWNILPEKCMVTQARLLEQNKGRWVDLSRISSGANLANVRVDITDSDIVYQINEVNRGNFAYDKKNHYYGHKDQQDYVEKLSSKLLGQIQDFKIDGLEKQSDDVSVEFKLKKDISLGDEFIYINPLVNSPFKENPFSSEQRQFPVNFDYVANYRQAVTFNVPKGYEVEEMPESIRIVFGEENDVVFSYRMAKSASQILLQYQIQINSLVILPEMYPDLRDLFAKIVMKNSEQIVLKKI